MEVSLSCWNLVRPAEKKLPPTPTRPGGGRSGLQATSNPLKWLRGHGSGPTQSPNKSEPGICGVPAVGGFLRKHFSKVGYVETQGLQFKVKGPESGKGNVRYLGGASFSYGTGSQLNPDEEGIKVGGGPV